MKLISLLMLAITMILMLVNAVVVEKRVVGGYEENDPAVIEWQALILRNGKVLCGGAMISYTKILTAAHCAITNANIARHSVVIGSNHFTNVRRYPIVRIFRHEKFAVGHRGDPLNDIAILEVHRPDTDESKSAMVSRGFPAVNTNYSLPLHREKLYVSGFGRTETHSDTSKKMRTTSVRTISRRQCAGLIRNITLENRICALSPGNDACTGDSGASLYGHGPSGTGRGRDFVIYGIVSFGIQCAHPSLPGIYVRVSRYSDWINAVLAIETTPYRSVRSVITILVLAGIAFFLLGIIIAVCCCINIKRRSKKKTRAIQKDNKNVEFFEYYDTNQPSDDSEVHKKTPWFQSPRKPLPVAVL